MSTSSPGASHTRYVRCSCPRYTSDAKKPRSSTGGGRGAASRAQQLAAAAAPPRETAARPRRREHAHRLFGAPPTLGVADLRLARVQAALGRQRQHVERRARRDAHEPGPSASQGARRRRARRVAHRRVDLLRAREAHLELLRMHVHVDAPRPASSRARPPADSARARAARRSPSPPRAAGCDRARSGG